LVGMGIGLVGLTAGAANLRATLLADPAAGLAWIERSYLALRHYPGGLNAAQVYGGLVHSLDFANPRTAFGLFMLGCVLLVVGGLVLGRRTARLWQVALVGLATVDLLLTGASFHQKMPVDQLAERTPAMQFLSERGEWRVYTPGESVPSMEFNRLVPFRIEDVGGYSSAEPRDHYAFWTT